MTAVLRAASVTLPAPAPCHQSQTSADTLVSIGVGEIHPSPANPRRGVGDVTELAASIAELGIVEPLIVTPAAGRGYDLVAGHRRLAAAAQAGVDEVPCIVRLGLDERAQAELRIVENLHRQDLAPIEEAVAYQGLIDLGYSQRALAKKVSRSQAHISRRLSLLKLPPPAIDALDTGRITIDEAITLARVPADKVVEVFKGKGSLSYEVGKVVREQEHDEKVAAARAELAKTGVTVIETIPTPAWKHRLDGPGGYGHLRLTPEEHDAEPCHVAVIHWEKVEHYCTDPDRHGQDGESDLKIPADEQQAAVTSVVGLEHLEEPAETTEEQAAQAERRAERESAFAAQAERKARRSEAIEARRAFAATAIADVDAAGAVELTALLYAHCFYVEDPFDAQTADLLGLQKDTFNNTPAAEQIKAFTAKGPRNRTRAVAAAAACLFETMATPGQFSLDDEHVRLHEEDDLVGARAWFAWLVGRGYELSDHDRELIPEPEPPAEPQPDDAVAWYDDEAEGPRWVDESEATAIGDVDPGRLHRVDPAETRADDGPITDDVATISIKKAGKRWKVSCSACGDVGANTSEAYANERAALHLAGHGPGEEANV